MPCEVSGFSGLFLLRKKKVIDLADRTLIEHIKRRLRLNHDIKVIREHLLKLGFSHFDVHQAIDAAFKEIDREAKIIAKEEISILEHIISPRSSKFILPILVFIVLILHLFGNVTIFPSFGKDLCDSAKASAELKKAMNDNSGNVAELQKAVWDKQVIIIDNFRYLLLYNFPLLASKAYKTNPFFPLPCETSSFIQSNYCLFYITEEDYDCIVKKDADLSYKLFGSNIPTYKNPSFFILLLNSILLLLIFYLINSFFIYFYERVTKKMTAEKRETIRFAVIFAILVIITLAILSYIYLLNVINARFG